MASCQGNDIRWPRCFSLKIGAVLANETQPYDLVKYDDIYTAYWLN